MPVLDAVAKNIIPTDTAKKRFDFRCDLLYPESDVGQVGEAAETVEPR
jgi:hypothetical protein